ncbi:hypothetical protein R3P38DRAFT_2769010 [Favolaschia claudopus]|uniref:Uncharacterized protein n=1 Tax=Favolaschia claudopus TaxID=2862362 RepID=A0AAW0CR46_9AGAR
MPAPQYYDNYDHADAELEQIFDAAVEPITQLLLDYDEAHPVISSFKQFLEPEPAEENNDDEIRKKPSPSLSAANWLAANGMDPTPELSVLMTHALACLMEAPKLMENLSDDEQTARVCSVGAVLLQLLAIQHLNEPFNLNGDLFLDITRDKAVVRERFQGLSALDLMLTALWDVRHGIVTLMNFKKNHTVWIEDHPPLF